MSNHARPRREAQFLETETPAEVGDRGAPSGARREHSRFRVDLDVSVTSEHNFYAGFVENMSVGGIFVATHRLKSVGEQLELAVSLPGHDEPIRASGQVRWLRVYSETSNAPPGMGIRFDALDEQSRLRIEAFLAQREPLFFEEG